MTALGRHNPFWVGEANWGEHGLFLERPALEHIDALSRDAGVPYVLLSGSRRIGKTSVLKRLQQRWQAGSPGQPSSVFYVDIRNHASGIPLRIEDPAALWASLDDRLVAAGVLEPADSPVTEPQALAARWRQRRVDDGPRVRILFDEVELLFQRDPSLVVELLRCFRADAARRDAFLVVGWGQWLGSTLPPEITWMLKDSPRVHLGPLPEDALKRQMRDAFSAAGLPLTEAAGDRLWTVSQGHPFYAMALARALVQQRFAQPSSGPIEASELTCALLKRAQVEIDPGLLHAWDQVNRPQHALCWGLARLAVTAQPPDEPFDAAAARRPFARRQVAEYLQEQRHPVDVTLLRSVTSGLVDNHVLERAAEPGAVEQWCVRSPFFAAWLASYEFDALDPDIRRVDDRTGKTAAELLLEAREASASGDDEHAAALLRRALRVAPVNPDLLVELARVSRRQGNLEEAAALLRQAQSRGDVATIRIELAEVLERQLQAALASDTDPLGIWGQYRTLSRVVERTLDPAVASGVTAAWARRWQEQLESGRGWDAIDTIEELKRAEGGADALLTAWRVRFLEHYTAMMRRFPESPERLQRCLGAIAHGLLWLTDEAAEIFVPPGATRRIAELPAEVRNLVAHYHPGAQVLGDLDPANQALFAPLLGSHRVTAPLEPWRVTLDVLAAALQVPSVSLPPDLDADAFRTLVRRAPGGVTDELRAWLRSSLAQLVARDAIAGQPRAAALLDLLWELEAGDEAPLKVVTEALDVRALELENASAEEASRAFQILPGLLHRLHARPRSGRARWISAAAAIDLAGLAIAAARRGHDKEGWRIVAAHTAAAADWRDLLAALRDAAQGDGDREHAAAADRLIGDVTLPADLAPMAAPVDAGGEHVEGDAQIRLRNEAIATASRLLAHSFYQIDEALDTTARSGGHPLVSRLRGKWRRSETDSFTEAHIKLYRLPEDEPTRQFLEGLWGHERRMLFDVGSRRKGRSLAELWSADLRTADNYLVLVTEPVGRLTLRDLLVSGRATRWYARYPAALWRELMSLMQALEALHDAHYMHRNLRPDTIHVRFDSESDESAFRFKLVDFEWSIYLHSMGDQAREQTQRRRDYYLAPEALASGRAGSAREQGESFASDLYALGLILFELLVRPLKADELRQFSDPRAYSPQAHAEFISGLRDEVRDPHHGLPQAAQLLVLGLVRFDSADRLTSLRTAIAEARKFAVGAEGLQASLDAAPLPVLATLRPGTPDAIASYIRRYTGIRDVNLETLEDTSAFIRSEIEGARVYENATSGPRRLFIEGKQISFTAMPFKHGDMISEELAYLWVATSLDGPAGEPLVKLTRGVTVHDLLPTTERHAHIRRDSDKRWSQLFSLVKHLSAPVDPAEQAEQTLLHDALERTVWAEADLLEEQIVAYRIVRGPTRQGRNQVLQIEPRATSPDEEADPGGRWRQNLRRTIARYAQMDDVDFELTPRHSSSDFLDDSMIWQVQDVDSDSDIIHLARSYRQSSPDPPSSGWIRPSGIAGSQALLARRRNLLRRLESDWHVLRAVNRPDRTHRETAPLDVAFFQDKLDADKQRIVGRMQTASPMLLVQGPPGTGKTTLAAEVVLQALAASPATRILITAQGHDPLNHLLSKVVEQLEAHRPTRKHPGRIAETLAVRLVPERRLSTTEELTGPGRDMETRYHPVKIALDLLAESKRWTPDHANPVPSSLLEAWKAYVDSETRWSISGELQRRLVNAANIVCVTANDRSLDQAFQLERPFDLLIYEEAARALPLELLGPMTTATRSLLIGDPDQLPPHQVQDLTRILGGGAPHQNTDQLPGDGGDPAGPERPADGLDPRVKALEILELFRYLWRRDPRRIFSDRLNLQYRMHPAIADSIRVAYYDGKLDSPDPDALRKERQHRITLPDSVVGKAIVWINTPWVRSPGVAPYLGEEPAAGGGYTNHGEVRAVQRFFSGPVDDWPGFRMRGRGGFGPGGLAFLSPYRAQVERFRSVFATWKQAATGSLQDVAHTVDSYQGRQADVVVVSLVRNNRWPLPRAALGFLGMPSRSVVMFSRAQSLLIVVGCREHFEAFEPQHSPIRKFLEQVRHFEQEGEAVFLPASDLYSPACYAEMQSHWTRREDERRSLRERSP